MSNDKGRILGVGGVFVKTQNAKGLRTWYNEQLGIQTNDYGALFEFRNANKPDQKDYLQWGTFPDNTDYFAPSEKEFMLNFRVDDLHAYLEKLAAQGITPIGEIQEYDYGKFAHIVDPEGTKIELWEPVEPAWTETAAGDTHK